MGGNSLEMSIFHSVYTENNIESSFLSLLNPRKLISNKFLNILLLVISKYLSLFFLFMKTCFDFETSLK